MPRRVASACARRALSNSVAPVLEIVSYMLYPLGDLQKEPGEHRIVTTQHPLQIEIRLGENSAGVLEIGKRQRDSWYQLPCLHIAFRAEAGGPADQIAVDAACGVGVQPDDLRHSVDVEGTGDEDARSCGVIPLTGDVAQPEFVLRAHQAHRNRALYRPVGEGQHGL